MKTQLKVGLVIADDAEYAALKNIKEIKLVSKNFNIREGHTFCLEKNGKTISVWAVCCGVGTVNAAVATQHLIDYGTDILVNYGLSGGISGVSRGEDVIGTSFFEYDFDLTCMGYKPCEKPGQKYIFDADERLVELALKVATPAKSGKFASGDRFVSDPRLRDMLKENFGAICCDMETAAIGSAAYFSGVPFISLRRVSDDAGEDATETYREMNNVPQEAMAEKALNIIKSIFDEESFWN